MVKIVLVMKRRLMAVMVNRRRGLSLVIVVMVKRKTMMVVMVADMTRDQQPILHLFVLSLFMEFTVSETLSYFGRLLNMTRETVNQRRY